MHVRSKLVFLVCLSLLLLFATPLAAQVSREPATRASAEVTIGLPAGSSVSVAASGARIVLDLPKGALFPLDIQSASDGFLDTRNVEALEDGGKRYTLNLERGNLERVRYAPQSVTLFLASRFLESAEASADEYLLGPGDQVTVTIHNNPNLASSPTISESGMITLPLVGDVFVDGVSARRLAVRLADLYEQYLVQPQVAVRVDDYRSQWVMVSGEVRAPGKVQLKGTTRLKEALTEAGGFGELAGEAILLTRQPAEGGDPVSTRIERTAFESGFENPALRHGDVVTIPRALYCYLWGEVRNPTRIKLERGMTLLKAITMAGGFTQWANPKKVQVRHEDETGSGTTYNINDIQNGKIPDPPLRGGEVIVVKRRFL